MVSSPHRTSPDRPIPAGAQHIVCMSSSYIAMLDALGQVDRIVAVSGINYIANPYILAHKDSIKDMGPEINYELIAWELKPDVVLTISAW